jgi:hypothetical protein
MVFMAAVYDGLARHQPEIAAAVDAHWTAALAGSEGPDGWYFSGQTRPDTHGLVQDDPATWADAIPRWLATRPDLSPGKAQPPETIAFVAGYLSHLGLDTWEEYQKPELPAAARQRSPESWFPDTLRNQERRQAAFRALGEAPFPVTRLVSGDELARAPIPPGFPAEAIRRVAAGIAPTLPMRDPWAMSRISPLRQMVDTPEERRRWEEQRARHAAATPEEYDAMLHAAQDFTLAAIEDWWRG